MHNFQLHSSVKAPKILADEPLSGWFSGVNNQSDRKSPKDRFVTPSKCPNLLRNGGLQQLLDQTGMILQPASQIDMK